jgi:type II secretory pathway component PulF
MPRFQYTATDELGNSRSGEIDASSAAEAAQRLERDGLTVVSIGFAPESAAGGATRETRPTADEPFPLSRKEFDTISGQIADITQAKLSLPAGLRMLAEELPNRRLQRALAGIADRLEAGMDIDQVLLAYDAPRELQAVFAAGKSSGRTADVLAQYSSHRRSRANTKVLMSLVLGYPLLLLMIAAIVVLFSLSYLVPSFKKIFSDFGTELPTITKGLIAWSDLCIRYSWQILGGFALLILIGYLLSRFLSPAGTVTSLVRHLPVVGNVWHWSSMAQFCHLLAVMLENRVPLPSALLLAGDTTDDEGIRAGSRQMATLAATGAPLVARGSQMRGFPASFIQVVTEHKQTDALPGALHAMADFFESRSRLQGGFLAAVFGPLIILFVGWVLGWIVIALFMPLVKLLNDIS